MYVHDSLDQRTTLAAADALDAQAAAAEESRASFSRAVWIAEGMVRDARSREDAAGEAEALRKLRDARRFVDNLTRDRDACRREARGLRESLGDFVHPDAMSSDWRVRYAVAASPYSTTATLVYLGQDPTAVVADEAAATWDRYHGGAWTLARLISDMAGTASS